MTSIICLITQNNRKVDVQVASIVHLLSRLYKIILICSVLAYVTIATNDLAKTLTNFFYECKKIIRVLSINIIFS